MTVTAPILTGDSDYSDFLPASEAAAIFQGVTETSVVQRLARQVNLGYSGANIPVFGDLDASWVSEGAAKPVNKQSLTNVVIKPKKIAVIVPLSMETYRANPANVVGQLTEGAVRAFAAAFDKAALFDVNNPFDAALSDSDKSYELGTSATSAGGAYGDLIGAYNLLAQDDYDLSGGAFWKGLLPQISGAVDNNGRPLYVGAGLNIGAGLVEGNLLGVRSVFGKNVHDSDNVGIMGDFQGKACWGVVGGIRYDVTNVGSATINGDLVSAFENNLVFVRLEAEYGFAVSDVNAFVLLTDAS